MRDYGNIANLSRATKLSALVTLMAVGRLGQGNMPLPAYLPLTFLAMIFVTGTVTAWGNHAGMPGPITDRRTLAAGAAAGLTLGLLSAAAHRLGPDAMLRALLQDPPHAPLLELALPHTLAGQLSLVLWSSGVQVLTLVAAPIALFARLTRNRWIALALCLVLRAYVVHLQLAYAAITEGATFFFAGALAATAIAGFLFTRFGLIPAMIFAGAADLHVFFPPP